MNECSDFAVEVVNEKHAYKKPQVFKLADAAATALSTTNPGSDNVAGFTDPS